MIKSSPWPTQPSCDAFYGDPHGAPGMVSQQWLIKNIVGVEPPFKMYYCGRPVSRLQVHRKCADSLLRVLKTIWVVSGASQRLCDEWGASIYGGAFNFRTMRGVNQLSIHSYGAAIDLDPARNGLYDRTPHFTPGSPVVQAFKSEGWIWGGDWDGDGLCSDEPRCDGMHFQAARVK